MEKVSDANVLILPFYKTIAKYDILENVLCL